MASHCHSHPFFFPLTPLSYMIILLISLNMTPKVNSIIDYVSSCSKQFNCGNLTSVGFPFWGNGRAEGCGYPEFYLNCTEDLPYITFNNITYLVKEVNTENHTLKIAFKELCPDPFPSNTTDILDRHLFDYVSGQQNLTLLYGCNATVAKSKRGYFECPLHGVADRYAYPVFGTWDPSPWYCTYSLVARVRSTFTVSDFENFQAKMKDGFEVKWLVGVDCDQCQRYGGVCGYDLKSKQTTCNHADAESPQDNKECSICITSGGECGTDNGRFACFCRDGLHRSSCSHGKVIKSGSSSGKLNSRIIILIGLSAGGTGILIIIAVSICIRKKCFAKRETVHDHDVEKFMENYGSLAPRRYTYSAVKRMTNSFASKLGQGGYGIVYKGSLHPDGHLVAVKLLTESKSNGEEFLNEVATISRTSHVNIVSLLGFCYERDKRALIYEFMPNGSLDNFVFKRGSPDAICNLEWKTMYQIAIGVGQGLEYLHQGCNTRILHLDIKPQNILLDEDFCPKISDFGLAKICQKKESIVSIIGLRGTAGFIAPEVLSRAYGGVSYKSDVYSYGMLVLEMVGGRKNFDNGGSHTSEMYFPDWIYKDLEQSNSNLSINMSITDEENEIVKKMMLVSLWCIQTNPSERPSMGKVVEMLEGDLDSFPFPPKPVLHSPPRPPPQVSDGSSSTNTQSRNSKSTQKDGSLEQSRE